MNVGLHLSTRDKIAANELNKRETQIGEWEISY